MAIGRELSHEEGAESRIDRALEAERRLMSLGDFRRNPALISGHGDSPDRLQSLLAEARAGNRIRFLEAMRESSAIILRSLARSPVTGVLRGLALPNASVSSALTGLRRYPNLVEEYVEHIQSENYSSEQRLTYLFAAARELRLLVAGVAEKAPQGAGFSEAQADLRLSLLSLYGRMRAQLRRIGEDNPEDRRFAGISLQVEMYRSLLSGDRESARLELQELLGHYRENPPPSEDEGDPESLRFYHRAAREFMAEAGLAELERRLDVPSSAEQGVDAVNLWTAELLGIAGIVNDRFHERDPAVSQRRNGVLATVLCAMSALRAGYPLTAILEELLDVSKGRGLSEALSALLAERSGMARAAEAVGGGRGVGALLEEARDALSDLADLGEGRHGSLGFYSFPAVRSLLDANKSANPIDHLAGLLYHRRELTAALGHVHTRDLGRLRAIAIRLFRDSYGTFQKLQVYAAEHPEESLGSVQRVLEDGAGAETGLSRFADEFREALSRFGSEETDLQAAARLLFAHHLAQERELVPGVRLREGSRVPFVNMAEHMEGLEFGLRRALKHLTSISSLTGMLSGALAGELAAYAMFRRVEAMQALGRPALRALVKEGRLRGWGQTMRGLGSGLGMALGNSIVRGRERDAEGLPHSLVGDFGRQALWGAVTFGTMAPLAQRWGRWLSRRVQGEAGRSFSVGAIREGGIWFLGAGAAMGSDALLRRWRTGSLQIRREDAAETLLTLLAWRLGLRGLRSLSANFRPFGS